MKLILSDDDQIATDGVIEDDNRNRNNFNNDNGDDNDYDDDDADSMGCGIGPFRPACLQPFANMYCFVFVCSLAELATACLRIYISTQISALERQFRFSSAKSGFLLACNDIGFLTTVLFVSHYLRHSHAPKTLAFLNSLYGLSGLICALPYFLGVETIYGHSKQYSETLLSGDFNSSTGNLDYEYMCQNPSDSEVAKVYTKKFEGENSQTGYHNIKWINTLALVIMATGLVIQGAAKSGRTSIVCMYVDDNTKKTKTGQFLAIFYAISVLGGPLSFISASIFSKLYFTLEETDLTPEDPRWIGAWWLGFLVFGLTSIIFVLPVMLFPRRMQVKNSENANKPETNKPEPETNLIPTTIFEETNGKKKLHKFRESFEGFFLSAIRILRQRTYVLLTTGYCLFLIKVAGLLSFNSKYIEIQFFLPAWKSNAIMGLTQILALSGGTLTGGLLTSKFKVSARGTLVILTTIQLISTIITPLQIHFGCDLPQIVGQKTISVRTAAPDEFLNPKCVSTCSCDEHKFLPVCFNNTITYFSPCFAGCQGKNGSEFIDCHCLPYESTVSSGFCDSGCNTLYYYLVLLAVHSFFASMNLAPSCLAYLRIVGSQDKCLAIAMTMFSFSLIGWTCGPILYGMLIDAACIVWTSTDTSSGACSLYDNTKLRTYLFSFGTVLNFFTCVLIVLSLLTQIHKEKSEAKDLKVQDCTQQETIKQLTTESYI